MADPADGKPAPRCAFSRNSLSQTSPNVIACFHSVCASLPRKHVSKHRPILLKLSIISIRTPAKYLKMLPPARKAGIQFKMRKNRWWLGLRPRPHWRSLQRSPRPPSWIKGGRFATEDAATRHKEGRD
jgi:hypothetical protein